MIAQGAHASMKVFFDRATCDNSIRLDRSQLDAQQKTYPVTTLQVPLTTAMRQWVEGIFTKVVVRAGSKEELLDLYRQALLARIPCALIEDSGKTEFGGVPTLTALAIGPTFSENINPITGHLVLL